MPPMTPTTLTRIDPAFPLLWRDIDTVQLGTDAIPPVGDQAAGPRDGAPLQVPVAEPWVEPLLQAMRDGFRRGGFDVLAHGLGAPRDAARALLRELEPVLRTDPPPLPRVWIESVNLADSRVASRLEGALLDEGFTTSARAHEGTVGIVLVHGAASAHHLAGYLRDDLPHVPIAFEPGGTTIGPLIRPGISPCLACRDAHERDRDPAWPSMHAQLIGATATPVTAARAVEAAGLLARLLHDADGRAIARSVRVTPDGHRAWREVTFHEECRCRGQSFRSHPGTARGDDPRVPPTATTTAPASVRHA